MKFMRKICDIIKKADINIDLRTRIIMGVGFVLIVVAILLNNSYYKDKNKDSGDTNVYLKEELCFADEIFVSVQSLSVTQNETNINEDEDGDELSKYVLNLGIVIEQRHNDLWTNKVKISASSFKLKSVNLEAKSKMGVFFECLAKETLSLLVSGSISGSINIIEETINYASDYTLSSIEEAINNPIDFKPIKASNSFTPFYPYKVEGITKVDLSFPIKKAYLESNNVIVLAINDITHFEKRIFLITRP